MIKFGIIGPGEIARKFASDIKLADDAIVTAVASRSLKKAQDFCQEFGISKAFGSYEEMVSSSEIDAVYIATPHTFHYEQTLLSLNHNKHVLCEKPIAVNKEQLLTMIQLARSKKLLLMEAMWSRFLPAIAYVRDMIRNNELGKLKHIEFSFGFELDEDYPDEGRLLNPNLAGGSILDLGIYPVSISNFLTDNKLIRELNVQANISSEGVDLDCDVNVAYSDGTTANLRSSISQDLDYTGYILFEKGEVKLHKFYHCESLSINGKVVKIPCIGEGFTNQINSFTETLSNGLIENEIMSYEDMILVIELLDIIRLKAGVIYPFEKNES